MYLVNNYKIKRINKTIDVQIFFCFYKNKMSEIKNLYQKIFKEDVKVEKKEKKPKKVKK